MKKLLFLPTLLIMLLSMAPSVAQAAEYNIKEMTPEVQQALDGRKGRYSQLSEFKAQGVIGENNRGYVELLTDDSGAQRIVDQENRDRKTIYTTIARQNGIEDELGTIERVFAQVQRDKASDGEMVQSEEGEWTKK